MIVDRFRDGKFDVLILAGPRVKDWPTAGSRAISLLCAEAGLTVGVFGGDAIRPRGVLPGSVTGGTALLEDTQGRLHRVQARAIVRIASSDVMPSPFEGWRGPGLIPYSTAIRLRRESIVKWEPSIAILGTGNRAFRFGSELLATGTQEVLCVETHGNWGAKRFAGWEVERRRFETLGGKLLEAKPLSLAPKGPLIWELRLQDRVGVRLHQVGRVVAVGPFEHSPGLREYPPGSLLFELEQTAAALPEEDIEGWRLEEERGRGLAARIVKSLVVDLGPQKDEVERALKRSRSELKRLARHLEKPFQLNFQGKWLAPASEGVEGLREFSGIPRTAQATRWSASVECVEEIGCDVCSRVCPEKAIDLTQRETPGSRVLMEEKCTGCGICVTACPSQAIALVNERGGHPSSWLGLPSLSSGWKSGEFGVLVNRKGESLGSGRIVEPERAGVQEHEKLLFVEVPSHVVWDARGIRRNRVSAVTDPTYLAALAAPPSDRVEITLNGEKRLVRDRIPVGLALFEIGHSRPEDVLLCSDGSCGLCRISVDGTNKWACQMQVHRGMAVRTAQAGPARQGLCPCVGVTREDALARIVQGKVRSAEAAVELTQVTRGTCHGQLCADGFRKLLCDHGLDASGWLDWKFPWMDWTLDRS